MDKDVTLVDILAEVDRLTKDRQSNIEKESIFSQGSKTLADRISIRYEPEPVQFDTSALENLTLASIVDYTLYAIDKRHPTKLLKDTNYPETMLLDGITSLLPDYRFLKCIAIDDKYVHFQFKDPLNIDAFKGIVQSTNIPHRINLQESRTRGGIGQTLYFDDVNILTIRDYTISLHYRDLVQKGKLEEGLRASTELVTKVHKDTLFRGDVRSVHFAQYQPIFKLLFPELFEDRTTELLKQMRDLARTQRLQQSKDFRETRQSQLYAHENKRYLFNKDKTPEHLEYIVACPDMNELYVRFGSNLDYTRIQEILRTQNLHLSADRREQVGHHKIIKKGGGYRIKDWKSSSISKDVLDQDGTRLSTFEGGNIVKLYLDQSDETFKQAARVFAQIYYGRLFYTSSLPTAEMRSDISKDEKMLISAIDALTSLYIIFLQVEEERDSLALRRQVRTPFEWVAQKMSESPAKTFEDRVLYVLNEINHRVDPQDFRKYGREPDTQSLLMRHYAGLEKLKGRFEAVCALRSN